MSIAIEVKVNDGVVLSADSATTMLTPEGGAYNVYDHANKIFNLHKKLPIGALAWGVGSIANASVATLVKDFRASISDGSDAIDMESYSVQNIANRLTVFLKEKYDAAFGKLEKRPTLGLLIAGYDPDAEFAADFRVHISGSNKAEPMPLRKPEETGVTWNGVTEPISRLILGFGSSLPMVLAESGLSPVQIQKVLETVRLRSALNVAPPAMPIQDAIELAVFLAEVATNFTKYAPGPPTVGGLIEVAAITKHEGFKWVRRKHYYDLKYNVPER